MVASTIYSEVILSLKWRNNKSEVVKKSPNRQAYSSFQHFSTLVNIYLEIYSKFPGDTKMFTRHFVDNSILPAKTLLS